jgi:2-(1,2-epoxy-1,2-dihydrophenyl)acetyl-CoA isomerase
MAEGGVRFEREGDVGRIVLQRPEASNALDLPTAQAFAAAVDAARADDVRAVLLAGDGKRFCAGGDVASFVAADDGQAYLLELARTLEAALRDLSQLSKPVVAEVHGAVAGAGLAFVLNSDVVVAARSTKFLMAYAGIGLTPDCGVSYLLPRAIGQQRALQMAVGGRGLTADEALSWGLVAEVVDDDAVSTRAAEVARVLAAGPTTALAEARRLIRSSWEVTREDNAKDEAESIAHAVATADAVRLIGRFTAR